MAVVGICIYRQRTACGRVTHRTRRRDCAQRSHYRSARHLKYMYSVLCICFTFRQQCFYLPLSGSTGQCYYGFSPLCDRSTTVVNTTGKQHLMLHAVEKYQTTTVIAVVYFISLSEFFIITLFIALNVRLLHGGLFWILANRNYLQAYSYIAQVVVERFFRFILTIDDLLQYSRIIAGCSQNLLVPGLSPPDEFRVDILHLMQAYT